MKLKLRVNFRAFPAEFRGKSTFIGVIRHSNNTFFFRFNISCINLIKTTECFIKFTSVSNFMKPPVCICRKRENR